MNKNALHVKKLIEKSENINNFIYYANSQYSILLENSSNYSLVLITNEIYGTIYAILKFHESKISDKSSVSTFAFTYIRFKLVWFI